MKNNMQHNQQRAMALAMAEAKYAYMGAGAVIMHADGIYHMMHNAETVGGIIGIRGMAEPTRTRLQYPIINTVNNGKRTGNIRTKPTGF